MADNLYKAFRNYTDAIQSKLQKRSEKPNVKAPLRLVINKTWELQDKVDELENGDEFRQLAKETLSLLSEDHRKRQSAGQAVVKQFFRRSSYYLDIFEGKRPNFDDTFQKYCEAPKRQKINISYLAPMEFVNFAEPLEFDAFQVRTFSLDQLKTILSTTVNEVFYPPWSHIDVEQLQLQNYWFIYCTEQVPVSEVDHHIPVDWDSILGHVRIKYTKHPRAIESALHKLALYNLGRRMVERNLWKRSAGDLSGRETQYSLCPDGG